MLQVTLFFFLVYNSKKNKQIKQFVLLGVKVKNELNFLARLFVNATMQGQLAFGELLPLTRQEGGRTEPPWKIWIWPFELVSKGGNLCTLVRLRY